MSISKRAMGVPGFKSDSRPELTLHQLIKWFPTKVIVETKDSFVIEGVKFKKIRIDEASDRKHYIEQRIII